MYAMELNEHQEGDVTETTKRDMLALSGSPTKAELQSAKDLIAFFLIAMKNYALYPEDNEIVQNSVANVATRLSEFIKNHGDFRFHVKRDRLLFQDQVIHKGASDMGNMALILFRDGIQWLEFQEGTELAEVAGFFKLLNQYRETVEESEGDLVTALWEAQFPHLRYEASDVFFENETVVDFSLLRVMDEALHGRDQEEEKEISETIAPPDRDTAMWQLTAGEMGELKEMVRADEERNHIEDILGVLMVILREHIEENDIESVLNFLRDEFRDALTKVEFQVALKLLEDLHDIHDVSETTKTWAVPVIQKFFGEVSGYPVLSALREVWPVLEILDSHRDMLRQILRLLSPVAIQAIALISLEVSSPRLQRELTEAMEVLASRDMAPLERLLNHPDKTLIQRVVVPVLKHLEGDRPSELLLTLVRNSHEPIRKQALDALMARDPQLLKDVFSLIQDDSDTIRMHFFKYMGKERNRVAEDLLLDYLEHHPFKRHDNLYILACYRALGGCGSERSIPFLRGRLLNRVWITGARRSAHRVGAAVAMAALDSDEAQAILDKASRSLFPFVRIACKRAMMSIS